MNHFKSVNNQMMIFDEYNMENGEGYSIKFKWTLESNFLNTIQNTSVHI